MKILIDTNIVLDHLLDRKPFANAAEWIFAETERGELETYLGATTITTVHYFVTKAFGTKDGKSAIEKLLRLFEIAPINRTILTSALMLKFADFEDAVLHEAAIHVGAQAIITRDIKGFQKADIAVYSSEDFVVSFHSRNKKS